LNSLIIIQFSILRNEIDNTFETIQFDSKDGLPITADLYEVENPKGFILLCHRSHCNRGEYRETAPKLNRAGFSCLTIDQRSGMKVFGVVNEPKVLAKQKGMPTRYLDAKPDIEAAMDYAFNLNNDKPTIIFGSSYSASLALLISAETDTKICTTVAFSPGEYLKNIKLADEIKLLNKRTFVTSSKKEIADVSAFVKYVDSKYVAQFKPEVDGFHGSKTLWE